MIGNGHAGFGRAASEKDPQGHLAGVVPRRAAIPVRSPGNGRANGSATAMRAWQARYGRPPSSYDWSRTHASRRGQKALERLLDGEWPAPATVSELYDTWAAAQADALPMD